MINNEAMKQIQEFEKRKKDLFEEIESLNNAKRIWVKGHPIEGMILQAHSRHKIILEQMDELKNTDGAKYISDIQSRNLYLIIQSHEVQNVVFKTPQRIERLRETSRILGTNEEFIFIISSEKFGKDLENFDNLNAKLAFRMEEILDEQGIKH